MARGAGGGAYLFAAGQRTHPHALARVRVPYSDSVVRGGRDEAAALQHGGAGDSALMPRQHAQEAALVDVPQAKAAVIAAGDEPLLVNVHEDAHGVNVAGKALRGGGGGWEGGRWN